MTITSNIHIGVSAWTNHTFALNEPCSNAGNAYRCITPGTAPTAPTGTSQDAIFGAGTAHFRYLSAIDSTSLQAWYDGIADPLTQPVVGQLWNNGVVQCTIGTILLFPAGKAGTSSTNTIMLKPAPGESFRDQPGASTPLNVDPTKGVTIQGATSGAASPVSYLWIVDPWFVVDGIQFLDTYATSQANFFLVANANNVRFDGCLFDSYTQTVGGDFGPIRTLGTTDAMVVVNCFSIDRATSNAATVFKQGNGSATVDAVVNCTFIAASVDSTAVGGTAAATNAMVVRNCAAFGQTNPFTGSVAAAVGVDHCVMSGSGLAFATDNGSNLFSRTAANQFVSTTVDFRLKAGADCINAAVNDTTDIPLSNDLFRAIRPSGFWDAGCFESSVAAAAAITEATSAVATPSTAVVAARAVAEVTTATVALTAAMVATQSAAEAATSVDAPNFVGAVSGATSEAASASDAPSAAMVATGAATEAATASDSPFGAAPFRPGITEAAIAFEASTAALVAARAATEAGSAASVAAVVGGVAGSASEAGMFFG